MRRAARGLLLAGDRLGLVEVGSYEVAVRQGRQDALPAPRRIERRIERGVDAAELRLGEQRGRGFAVEGVEYERPCEV